MVALVTTTSSGAMATIVSWVALEPTKWMEVPAATTPVFNSSAPVTIDLGTGVATGGDAAGTFTNIRGLVGSSFDDVLTGDLGANYLEGGDGNDVLHGGDGDDRLQGSARGKHLDGGAGIDSVEYVNSAGAITVNLLEGTGSGGDAEGDGFTSIDNMVGSRFDDNLLLATVRSMIRRARWQRPAAWA